MTRRRYRTWIGAGALLLAGTILLGAGCGRNRKWNVLLITTDTTRADHLRCYGYDRIETPNLGQLAREGVLFERAYSHVPLTLPAHTSIMTGTVPLHHSVEDNGSYHVPDQLTTLAEALQAKGYRTAAFVSAAVLLKWFNLNQGFDVYDQEGIEAQKEGAMLVAERKGDKTTDAALAWLAGQAGKPFFLWVHYYDPHASYSPPAIFNKLYKNPYDGEIAFMDTQIGRLLDRLRQDGIYDRTLIIAIADHGESLGQHQENSHAVFIYEPTQHIPCIMRIPGLARTGVRIRTVVKQNDVMPTVLDYLGIAPPPDQFTGESLRPIIEAPSEPDEPRYAFIQSKYVFFHFGWSPLTGLVGPRFKYIRAPGPELYNLDGDTMELNNLLDGDSSALAPAARSALDKMRLELDKQESYFKARQIKSTKAVIANPALDQQLAALGYMAGAFQVKEEKAKGKDPKALAFLLEVLQAQRQAMVNNDFEEVLLRSATVLDADPDNPEALLQRAEALFALRRHDEAIAAYRTFFERQQETPAAWVKLSLVYTSLAQQGATIDPEKKKANLDLAISALQRALELEPKTAFAHYYLGRLLIEQGSLEEAITHFSAPGLADTQDGHVGLALVYERQGRLPSAENEFKKAADLIKDKDDKSVLYYTEWAAYLIRHGRADEAVESFEKAFAVDPSLKNEPLVKRDYEYAKKMKVEKEGK
jgi:choline-sulfatase